MSFRRYISTVFAALFVGLAALAVVAQDATPTTDPAMMPTTDPAMMPTTDPAMMPTTDPAMMPTTDPMGVMNESAMAPIMDASGAQIGWASFTNSMGMTAGMGLDMGTQAAPGDTTMTGNGKVLVTVQLQSAALTPGFHGMHLHMMGNCGDTGEGPFTGAGEHIPAEPAHPNHIGDFPAALVNADGTAFVSFETDRFTVADLLDADGTAIIIHGNPDNYANIPERYGTPDQETLLTGDAGPRFACGVIQAGMAGAMGTTGMTGTDATGGTGTTGTGTDTTGSTGIGTDTTAPTTDPAMMPTTDPAAAPTTDPAMMPTATTAG
jgi:superoxide dismutase, Cu-Zn family